MSISDPSRVPGKVPRGCNPLLCLRASAACHLCPPRPCLPVSLTTWERTACSVLHKPNSIILIHPSKKKMHPKVQETHPRRVRSQPAWRGNSLKIGVNHLLVHKRPEHLPLLMWKQEARALFFLFAWVVLHTCGAHPKRVLPRGSIIKQNSDAGQIHSLA